MEEAVRLPYLNIWPGGVINSASGLKIMSMVYKKYINNRR
jgi:hypothetical protein